ncbi:MAG: alanine racemase [Rikenellaceae bacterium]
MQYKLSEIAHIIDGELFGCDQLTSSISTDSRWSASCAGTLFVAMKGANHDSHRFINEMIARGVTALLTEQDIDQLSNNISYIKVNNSIDALQSLAKHHRESFKGCVVGVTGSNGKTTVKEWFAQTAPSSAKIFRSPRSYNSQLGVALSLLMIEGDEDVAVIEAGISQPNEMAKLEAMIQPDIAILTSIGEAHQEGFESIKQKVQEKLILGRSAKSIIYNSNYPEVTEEILYCNFKGTKVDAADFAACSNFSDAASMRNSQVIAALHHALGYAAADFSRITPVAMRLELIEGLHDSLILNDSYNNDINSLAIALEKLQSVAGERKTVVILSDILQSGTDPKALYKRIAEILESNNIDFVVAIGNKISKNIAQFKCDSKSYKTTEEFLSNISVEDYAGRAILLKGNRECRLEKIGHALSKKSHSTTLEVNLDRMISNLNYYRSKLQRDCKMIAMVKANSYGAGDYEVAQTLQEQGVDYLAVAFADEGSRLRERGITMPIIVLNADDGSFSQMVQMGLEPEIYSIKSLESFAAAVVANGERNYPIHIKLDTGMHRLGFMDRYIAELTARLKELRDVVKVASIFSHLSSADVDSDECRARTEQQIADFDKTSSSIIEGIGYTALRHIANSAGIEHYPSSHFDMVRLGIGLYKNVSTLKSRIVQIREIESDERVGYGGAGKCSNNSKCKIATIPIGYADGMDRHLSNGAWSLLINGAKAPIVGRICMDSCMVEITDIAGVEEGDEVIIFSDKFGNTAEDMATVLDTISYEVLTSISGRVKRIYIKE